MKKILFALVAIFAFAACDVIKQDDRFEPVGKTETSERKVLLMDFTGWRCVNCPDAAENARQIAEAYPENCIVVSMHPEGMTFTNPGTEGPEFASKEAMDYFKAFGGSLGTGLPKGVIDMKKYRGEYLNSFDRWAAAVLNRMNDTARYTLEVKADEYSYTVNAECIQGLTSSNEHLLVWLVEDSIMAPQLTQQGEEHEYMHRHVFRRCLNGDGNIWGEFLAFDFDDKATASGEFTLDPLVGKHYVVVAALIDGETHEVLQCAETEIGAAAPVKNPGFFTVTDENNEIEYKNNDTIYVSHFEYGEMVSHFNVNIDDQSAVDFCLDEERDPAFADYIYSMCVFGECRTDFTGSGHWGPFEFGQGETYPVQHHVMIPDEDLGGPQTIPVKIIFSNGNPLATMNLVFIYQYTPQTDED